MTEAEQIYRTSAKGQRTSKEHEQQKFRATTEFVYWDVLPKELREYLAAFPCGVDYARVHYAWRVHGIEKTLEVLEDDRQRILKGNNGGL